MKTIADLKGKRVAAGLFGDARRSTRLSRAMLATGGLTENDIKPVLVPNVVRGADDFVSGAADMFIFAFGGREGARGRRHGRRHPRAGDPREAAWRQRARSSPYGYLATAAPGPVFVGVDQPMKVYAWDNMLFTNAKVPDDVVYKIIDTLENEQGRPGRGAAGVARVHRRREPLQAL